MIQGSSLFNMPFSPVLAKSGVKQASPTPELALDSTVLPQSQSLALNNLDTGGANTALSLLIPLVAYMMQALLALSAMNAQQNQSNPFADLLSSAKAAAAKPPNTEFPQSTVHVDATDEPEEVATTPEETVSTAKPAETKPPTKTNEVTDVSNNPPATQPPNSVNVKDFGAVGDGKTDDQAALQKAIDEAKATGKSVWIPEGSYNHSGVLTVDGTQVNGAGKNTVLNATNPDQSAVKLTGDSPSLSNIKTTVDAPNRSSMPDAAAVLVQNASNASVSHVIVQGAASNGIRLDNATNSKISNNLVLGTNADGIALMNGSSNNIVQHNVVYQASDDSYSDDSYRSDAKQDKGNTFDSNLSLDNAYGRGIVLAGSKNATVTNNIVSGSKWIGIWGDSDPNSGTMDSTGHTIRDNTVINSPNGAPVQANGAGTTVSGTKTDGSVPSLVSILGWDPGELPDRNSFNTTYVPGTGSGANNSGGVRT